MKFLNVLESWFFIKIDVRQYAMLRIGIGILIFIYLYQLYPLIDLHFSQEGWQGSGWNNNVNLLSSWSALNLLPHTIQM